MCGNCLADSRLVSFVCADQTTDAFMCQRLLWTCSGPTTCSCNICSWFVIQTSCQKEINSNLFCYVWKSEHTQWEGWNHLLSGDACLKPHPVFACGTQWLKNENTMLSPWKSGWKQLTMDCCSRLPLPILLQVGSKLDKNGQSPFSIPWNETPFFNEMSFFRLSCDQEMRTLFCN